MIAEPKKVEAKQAKFAVMIKLMIIFPSARKPPDDDSRFLGVFFPTAYFSQWKGRTKAMMMIGD